MHGDVFGCREAGWGGWVGGGGGGEFPPSYVLRSLLKGGSE